MDFMAGILNGHQGVDRRLNGDRAEIAGRFGRKRAAFSSSFSAAAAAIGERLAPWEISTNVHTSSVTKDWKKFRGFKKQKERLDGKNNFLQSYFVGQIEMIGQILVTFSYTSAFLGK